MSRVHPGGTHDLVKKDDQLGRTSWRSYGRLVSESRSLKEGRQVHRQLVAQGFPNATVDLYETLFLGNNLLNMYVNFGSPEDVQAVFDVMPLRNAISWNALIRATAEFRDALVVFHRMLQDGAKPDMVVFLSLIKSPGKITFREAKIVHESVKRSGFQQNLVVGTALVGLYGKCGSIQEARNAFDRIPEPNTVSWNALMTVCIKNSDASGAIRLFEEMNLCGTAPTKITFVCAASAAAKIPSLSVAKRIHELAIESGFISDTTVANSVMNAYERCGQVGLAKELFDRMARRDSASWNTLVAAFAHTGHFTEALTLYRSMDSPRDEVTFVNALEACDSPEHLVHGRSIHSDIPRQFLESDRVVGTALLSMYRRCGSLQEAIATFEGIDYPSVITWNAIICAYSDHGQGQEALCMFRRMLQQGVSPSKFTFVTVLGACSMRSALADGTSMHTLIVELPQEDRNDVLVQNALVNMYGKCGRLVLARQIFDALPQTDPSSWNAVLSVYAQHGMGFVALEIFYVMQQSGVMPDGLTYTSALSASSHAQLLEDGVQIFYGISSDYGLDPTVEHYGCVTDLLGRAGWLEEAEKFLNRMPFPADLAAWMALLGACRMYKDDKRGLRAAEMIVRLDPQHAASYTVLCNIYSAAGRWDEAEKYRKLMMSNGARKEPGKSWIEVNNRMHTFMVKDRSHPRTEEIYTELERMNKLLKEEEGYVPDTKDVFHDVEDEHKEHLLWQHSEKIALAFGMVSTPAGTGLQIIKNLRICDDCHQVVKLVSKIAKRSIVVRDCYRFHHFEAGSCSCRDCW